MSTEKGKKPPVLNITERVQAGSVMLFRFKCPKCSEEEMTTYPFGKLPCCGLDVTEWEFKVRHRRLLTGTRRLDRISRKTVELLKQAYGTNCLYCQVNCQFEYHIDHIIPLSAGGNNDVSNLCISCPACNLTAGSKVFSGPAAKRRYILAQRGIAYDSYDWGLDDRIHKCYGIKGLNNKE